MAEEIRHERVKNEKKKQKKKYEMCEKLANIKQHKVIREKEEVETDQPLDREVFLKSILSEYMESLSRKSQTHLGYPIVPYSEYYNSLAPFLRFHINNAGDPFISGNFAMDSRKFEVEVLDWFANLWEIENDEYWGYVTNGGTEGNFHGLLLGREMFPSGILYTSTESHYSIFKAARILRMECVVIETSITGKIDIVDLKAKLLLNTGKPAIINVNIGTTFKGALDDLDLVIETLNKCGLTDDQFYIHCDAALSGILVPFLKFDMKISFKKPIGSITISGHKFLGCPIPCGVQMTRKKHINILSKSIEIINTIDATISGSRNGHSPIFLWYILNHKGHSGIKKDVINCLGNAHYLANRLRKVGISTMLNESSITVVFERPHDLDFVCKWQLACVNNMAHIVVLPNINVEVIDKFCDDLIKTRNVWYANKNFTTPCVAADMGDNNCCCAYHKVRLQLNK